MAFQDKLKPVSTSTPGFQAKLKPIGAPKEFRFNVPEAPKERENKVARYQAEAAESQKEAEKSNSFLGKVGNFGKAFVGTIANSEVGLGKSLAKIIGAGDPHLLKAQELGSEVEANLLREINKRKATGQDSTRLQQEYNRIAGGAEKKEVNQRLGEQFTLPTKTQVGGQIGGTALDLLTAGSYGKAQTAGMTSFQRAPAASSFVQKSAVASGIPELAPIAGQKSAGIFTKPGLKNVAAGTGIGYTSDVFQGLQGARGEDRTGGKAFIPGMGTALGFALPATAESVQSIKNIRKGETSANIMQRVARINALDQEKFANTAGESVGEYLVKRGIYGNDEEIIGQLADRFTKSKSVADDSLAKLQGTWKNGAVEDVLNELGEREMRISTRNVPSKDLSRIQELGTKYNKQGLTMSEINEVKRMYERNVKLGYLKENNTEKVAQATNLDDALRAWQFEQAEKLGFKNLAEINRETRLARQLGDALFKKNERSGGNNAFGLTDAILISGGDPQAIAMLLTKKTFGSKGVQSAIAKKIAPAATVGQPKAVTVPVALKNTVQDLNLPKPNTGIPSVIMGTQNKAAPRKGVLPVKATDAKPVPDDLTLPSKRPFGELNFKTKESTAPMKAGVIPVKMDSSKPKSPQSVPKKVSSALPATILGKSGKSKVSAVDRDTSLLTEAKKYKSAEEFVGSEKTFEKKYVAQHKDIASPNKEQTREAILKEGFQEEGFNVNALPIHVGRSYNPSAEVLDYSTRKFGNRKGDYVYILPKAGVIDAPNGYKNIKGHKPTAAEVVRIEYDGQSTYEAYKNQLTEIWNKAKSGKAKAAAVDMSSFERAKDLTPEYRGIEDKAFERITREEDSIIEKYLANPKLSGDSRKVVNTDNFRSFFKEDGYAGYNAAAVQEPSSYLSKKAYTKLLKENPEEQVVFLAGGSGSGKTSAVKGLPEIAETMKNSAAVLDSNLSSYESAVAKIKEAQSYGKIPVVDYVYRDPVDSLVEGVVKRMINNADEGGRLVPTKVVAGNHIDSWDVVNKLREDGVGVNFIDNSLGAKKARVSSWEEMTKKIKYPSKKELTDIFNKEIKKLYEQGIIKSKEQFEAYIK